MIGCFVIRYIHTLIKIGMETNRIIEEIRAVAKLDWGPEQKAFYEQRAADARVVECVPMRDVFTTEQLRFLFKDAGYKTQQKMCYKNAADLVNVIANPIGGLFFPEPIWYVEGFSCSYRLLPIEHAFVKYGDKY